MSGRKAKESRRTQRDLLKNFDVLKKDLERREAQMVPNVITAYNLKLNTMPLWRRIIVAWRVVWATL